MLEDEKTIDELVNFLADQAEEFWVGVDEECDDIDRARLTTVALLELGIGVALAQQDIPKADFLGLVGAIFDKAKADAEQQINSEGSNERN